MISRVRWVLFMCSLMICMVACTGGDTDPEPTPEPVVEEEEVDQPTPGFVEAAGLRDFINNDLSVYYDDFLKETISDSWENDWASYDNTLIDFVEVAKLFKGTNPFGPGILTHYFQQDYPLTPYATITLNDLIGASPGKLYFREDLIKDGAANPFVYNGKQVGHLAEGRAYWGVKNIEYVDNDPAKPYVPFLLLVDETWRQRIGRGGPARNWVDKEYLLVFEGKILAYGAPRVGNDAVWPYTNGIPGEAIEGQFWEMELVTYDSKGNVTSIAQPSLIRYESQNYLLRQTREYGNGSMVADVEPNDQPSEAWFVPIGYSSGTDMHSLQVGNDSSDNFLISAIAGCNDGTNDTDPECANPVVLSTRIDVSTSHANAQLKLELIDAVGGFGILENVVNVDAGGDKYIIFDGTHIQSNVDNLPYSQLYVGQKLIVRVSILNSGELPENETVNYRLRIVSQE